MILHTRLERRFQFSKGCDSDVCYSEDGAFRRKLEWRVSSAVVLIFCFICFVALFFILFKYHFFLFSLSLFIFFFSLTFSCSFSVSFNEFTVIVKNDVLEVKECNF